MIRNAISLFVLQFGAYLAPLLTLPFLTRALGAETFGVLAMAYVAAAYGLLFAEWGFNFIAVRQVALLANDRTALSRVFWATMSVRLALAVTSSLGLLGVMVIVPAIGGHPAIAWSAWSLVAAGALNPQFALQGLEKIERSAYLSVGIRLATIPLTVFLVRSSQDAWLAALIQGAAALLTTTAAAFHLYREGRIDWVLPKWAEVVGQLSSGLPTLLSNFFMAVLLTSGTLFVGAFVGAASGGLFYSADRIRMAAQGLIGPISQAVYPRMSVMIHSDGKKSRDLFFIVLGVQCALIVIVAGILSWASELIMFIVGGASFISAAPILRILAWVPALAAVTNVVCVQLLMARGYARAVAIVYGISAGVALIAIPYAIGVAGVEGAAWAVLFSELCALLSSGVACLLVRGKR